MSPTHKPLIFLIENLVQTPPFGQKARQEAGHHIRRLQAGTSLSMPISRPMPSIGSSVHELRIDDAERRVTWRIFYRIESDAIVVIEVVEKKTQQTPKDVIQRCKDRLATRDHP